MSWTRPAPTTATITTPSRPSCTTRPNTAPSPSTRRVSSRAWAWPRAGRADAARTRRATPGPARPAPAPSRYTPPGALGYSVGGTYSCGDSRNGGAVDSVTTTYSYTGPATWALDQRGASAYHLLAGMAFVLPDMTTNGFRLDQNAGGT